MMLPNLIAPDDEGVLAAAARALQERAKTLKEMAEKSTFFFTELQGYDEKAAKKNLTSEAVRPLTVVLEKLEKSVGVDVEEVAPPPTPPPLPRALGICRGGVFRAVAKARRLAIERVGLVYAAIAG